MKRRLNPTFLKRPSAFNYKREFNLMGLGNISRRKIKGRIFKKKTL